LGSWGAWLGSSTDPLVMLLAAVFGSIFGSRIADHLENQVKMETRL